MALILEILLLVQFFRVLTKFILFLWIFLDSISTLTPRIMAASYQSSARGLTSQTSSLNGGKDQENKFILRVEKRSWKAVIWVLRGDTQEKYCGVQPWNLFLKEKITFINSFCILRLLKLIGNCRCVGRGTPDGACCWRIVHTNLGSPSKSLGCTLNVFGNH